MVSLVGEFQLTADLAFPGPFKLAEAPSSIEALRMVGKGHPTVIKGW